MSEPTPEQRFQVHALNAHIDDLQTQLAAAQAELERVTAELATKKVTARTFFEMANEYLDDAERAEAEAAQLREVLQDVTDVASSRQRVEWRNDSEQDAIDAALSALATTPTDALERQRRVQAVVDAAQFCDKLRRAMRKADMRDHLRIERRISDEYEEAKDALWVSVAALAALDAETEARR